MTKDDSRLCLSCSCTGPHGGAFIQRPPDLPAGTGLKRTSHSNSCSSQEAPSRTAAPTALSRVGQGWTELRQGHQSWGWSKEEGEDEEARGLQLQEGQASESAWPSVSHDAPQTLVSVFVSLLSTGLTAVLIKKWANVHESDGKLVARQMYQLLPEVPSSPEPYARTFLWNPDSEGPVVWWPGRETGGAGGEEAARRAVFLVTQAGGGHRGPCGREEKHQRITKCHVSSSTDTETPSSGSWRYLLVACPLLRSGSIIDLSSTANCSTPRHLHLGGELGALHRAPLCSEPSLLGSHVTTRARGQAGKHRGSERPSQHPAVGKGWGTAISPSSQAVLLGSPPQAKCPGGRIHVQQRWHPMKTAARKLGGRKTAWVKAGPPVPARDPSPRPVSHFFILKRITRSFSFVPWRFSARLRGLPPFTESLQDSDSKGNSAAPGLFLCFSHFPSGTNLGQQLWQVPEQRCWGPGDCLVWSLSLPHSGLRFIQKECLPVCLWADYINTVLHLPWAPGDLSIRLTSAPKVQNAIHEEDQECLKNVLSSHYSCAMMTLHKMR